MCWILQSDELLLRLLYWESREVKGKAISTMDSAQSAETWKQASVYITNGIVFNLTYIFLWTQAYFRGVNLNHSQGPLLCPVHFWKACSLCAQVQPHCLHWLYLRPCTGQLHQRWNSGWNISISPYKGPTFSRDIVLKWSYRNMKNTRKRVNNR